MTAAQEMAREVDAETSEAAPSVGPPRDIRRAAVSSLANPPHGTEFRRRESGSLSRWHLRREISRSMDGQMFLLEATHYTTEVLHRSVVIDPTGVPVASSEYRGHGLVTAVVDLDQHGPVRYVGEFKPHTPGGYLRVGGPRKTKWRLSLPFNILPPTTLSDISSRIPTQSWQILLSSLTCFEHFLHIRMGFSMVT